jgi:hypothetical protein
MGDVMKLRMIDRSKSAGADASLDSRRSGIRYRPLKELLLSGAMLLSGGALAGGLSVDWYTIDGGGTIQSESADQRWQLSGTIGQWDSTRPQALTGGNARLTGGFWAVFANPVDAMFRDRFEAPPPPRMSVQTEVDRDS